jgi:hypothetical protein
MGWTQAAVMRAVKATLAPAHAMGLNVASYKVTFCEGIPTVEVILSAESAPPPPPTSVGGIDDLKKRLKAYRRA